MKEFTDGVLTIYIGSKYAHVFNRAGSKLGRADITDGSYLDHMKKAGFKERENDILKKIILPSL